MSLAVYSDLTSIIGTWLARTDSRFTGSASDMVALAERRIFRDLRVPEMESALNSTIATGTIAVPSDYLELKSAYVDGSPITPLTRTSIEALYDEFTTRSATDIPTKIARNGTNFEFGPYPDSNYTIKGVYYAQPLTLSGSQTTNSIFPTYSDLYFAGSMFEAARFVQDADATALWRNEYATELQRIHDQYRTEAWSGSLIQPRAV